MERKNFEYSLKCIPLHPNKTYMKVLISKTEKFVKNLRWRALAFKNPSMRKKNSHGFKTLESPQMVPELVNFEKELFNIVKIYTSESTPILFKKN